MAPRICFAKECKNARGRSDGVSFYKLPADLDRKRKWLLIVDNEKAAKTQEKNIQICSDHFNQLDFTFCFAVSVAY